MKNEIAHVKTIKQLMSVGETLRTRSPGVPGIGLVWGATGAGKTTAAHWWALRVNAVYLRAVATWTPSSMLGALMRELDSQPLGTCAAMLEHVVQELAVRERPVVVDEADYLTSSKKLIETLRDLHDLSNVPVILIGMADFRRKVVHREQLAGRVAQWVEFRPCDVEDARIIADTVCEVHVAEDLLQQLHVATRGSVRDMVVGLQLIESWGRRHGKDKVAAKDWGRRAFTLTGTLAEEAA